MREYEFNPNNIDHCLERADALKALREGAAIEVIPTGEWINRGSSEGKEFAPDFRYRRKPTPVARPWSGKPDVPRPICWLRFKDDENAEEFIVTGVHKGGVCTANSGFDWRHLERLEHSTDGENWRPCTTTEP